MFEGMSLNTKQMNIVGMNIVGKPKEQESETTPPEVPSDEAQSTAQTQEQEPTPQEPLPEADSSQKDNAETAETQEQEAAQSTAKTSPTDQKDNAETLPSLESYPTLPTLPTLPTAQVEALPEPQDDILTGIDKEFLAHLEKALDSQSAWKEQVYLTLQGVSRVLFAYSSLRDIYNKNYHSLMTNGAEVEVKTKELKNQIEHISGVMREYHSYFDEFSSVVTANNNTIIANMNVCIKQRELCEKTLLETQKETTDILAFRQDILATLEKLKALQEQKEEFLNLYATAKVYMTQIETLQNNILQSITQRFEDTKAELETKKGVLSTELIEHKERLQSELQSQADTLEARVSTQIQAVELKITELEASFTKKQESLESAHSQLQEAQTAIQEAKDEFQNIVQEHSNTLNTNKDNHLLALNTAKDTHITALNNEAKRHSDDFAALKDNYKAELDSVSAAELAALKQYIEQIQSRTTQFGANFRRVTYTAGTHTFSPPVSGIYYYVFLQGGTGADNSHNSGGITSFGNHLSARGGAGGSNGKGMRGECVSGFVEVSGVVSVSVGGGGVCIISYTIKEATS